MYNKLQKAISRRSGNRLRNHMHSADKSVMTRNWDPSVRHRDPSKRENSDNQQGHSDTTGKEHRDRLLKVLDVCTTKLRKGQTRQHVFVAGDDCNLVRGKYYGARGIIRDIDFIHNKILVDIKSYREPIWLSLSEVEPC